MFLNLCKKQIGAVSQEAVVVKDRQGEVYKVAHQIHDIFVIANIGDLECAAFDSPWSSSKVVLSFEAAQGPLGLVWIDIHLSIAPSLAPNRLL